MRMTLVDVLEDAGFKVIEAVHADEANSGYSDVTVT